VQPEELLQLYRSYGYLVFRRCLALLNNRVDAEDAMQEVFFRVQRYGASFDRQNPLAWLYKLAANCCFDLLKKAGRAAPTDPAELAALDGRSTGGPHDGDVSATVGALLRRLDEKTRHIGLLHHLGGLTQEEVASETGYSRRTIGKKLQLFDRALNGALR
jgi:RNA polymerase sigma-70 factor (ECF subfamily)